MNEIIDISNLSYKEIEIKDISKDIDFTMDIEVENSHLYLLENGIISHNTTSLMTQTSSGIEPVFLINSRRRRKVSDKTKATFIDESGDMWEEYNVLHHKFVDWYMINHHNEFAKRQDYIHYLSLLSEECLQEIIERSPYYQATSDCVDWKESVRMQGEMQKWVDHSISKTINLPENATVETVDELFKEAYKRGCKGVTVYREGSRSGVLLSGKEKKKEEFEYVNSLERDNPTDCDIYHISVLGEKTTVFIGLKESKPFEIFVIPTLTNDLLPIEIKTGKVFKVRRGVYELVCERSEKEYRIRITDYMGDEEKVSTREYSLMLRSRIHPKHIVEQVLKSGNEIVSFKKAIARVLKKYIKEGEEITGEECISCGGKLIYSEGCMRCSVCGESKCG
jgi:ribonucleoside-diphosphate reductase alpha chain